MAKYLVNNNIHGYEIINVKDYDITFNKDDILVVIVDKNCKSDSSYYFNLVDDALRCQTRVILLGVKDGNDVFDAIASNMLIYKAYDMYQIEDKDLISAEYLIKITERHPDYNEAQSFISNSDIAYQDICTLIYGIESLINEGNIDGLISHIEKHNATIEGMITAINKMRKTCELFNSNELVSNIDELKAKINDLLKQLDNKDNIIDDVKHNRDEYKVEVEKLKREIAKLKETESMSGDNNGSSVIKSYATFNTAVHGNSKALVIYFKEISYVRYTNTLIEQIMSFLEKKKKDCKLLIYDNNVNMLKFYGLDVINGLSYASDKQTVLRKKKFIVSEPIQSLIQDIVSSDRASDIVIIYDRLRQYDDIIKGNNVTKFFVANSKKDVREAMAIKALGCEDTGHIITDYRNTFEYDDASKKVEFLNIPEADPSGKFSLLSDSAKFQRYMKLHTVKTDVPLMDTIIKKSHIEF